MLVMVARVGVMAAMMSGAKGRAWVHPEARNYQEEGIRKKGKRRRPQIQQSSPKGPEINRKISMIFPLVSCCICVNNLSSS